MTGQQITMFSEAAEMALSVRLETPLVLLAQTVTTALRSRGVAVDGNALPGVQAADQSEILVVIDDLVSTADVRRVLALVGSGCGPVLVLTGRERGPYWGALVSAGASSVMSSASSLDEVVGALAALRAGNQVLAPDERAELIVQWDLFRRQQREVAMRLATLTPKERIVFAGMRDGAGVSELAVRLDVAEATVRSHVKSILRKMRVRSQLTAVALVRRFETPLVAAAAVTVEPRRLGGEKETTRGAD